MWRRHGWRLLALGGLVLVAYSNSFQAALTFDNASAIGEDPRIREATTENIESILKGRYWYGNGARAATRDWYRPLTTFSYLVNYAVLGNGPRPAGYHWVNLALHEVNVALVYALGVVIFGGTAPAWALAAIWGLHPLLTEAVTNIVGRADLLAAFGVLAGLLCHVKGASAAGRRRVAWLAGLAGAQASRAVFEGERRCPAGHHAAIRLDVAGARDLAPACGRLCRRGAADCRLSLFAQRFALARGDRSHRESPGERRFLDHAAHGR
jgi:hypothetical protein